MLKELFTAALGMQPQQTRLEVTANNMANANTAGYKKDCVFERNLIDARANFYNVPGDVEQDDPPVGSYIDFSAGAFNQTDNPLDIAIEGDGFFVLEDELGKKFLTRDGGFKLTKDGTIVAMDGKVLQGIEGSMNVNREFFGDPFKKVDADAVSIRISENGDVFANDYNIGTVQIAKVDNPESLEKISSSNFITTKDTFLKFLEPEEIKVRQGWLEGSNVDVVKEMVSMIELQRMYEAGSKVLKTNEGTLDQSIRMGRFY